MLNEYTIVGIPKNYEESVEYAEIFQRTTGIHHLSPSAIKKLNNDPWGYFKGYVLGDWDETVSSTMNEGTAVHTGIEAFYTVENADLEFCIKMGVEKLVDLHAKGNVEYKDGQDLETATVNVKNAIRFYIQENPLKDFKVISNELKSTQVWVDSKGRVAPVPCKCVTDMAMQNVNKENFLVDFKVVEKFSSYEKTLKQYIIPIVQYYYMSVALGMPAKYFQVIQICKYPRAIKYKVDELKELLTAKGIEFGKAKKDELVELALENKVIERPSNLNIHTYEFTKENIELFEALYWANVHKLYVVHAMGYEDNILTPNLDATFGDSFEHYKEYVNSVSDGQDVTRTFKHQEPEDDVFGDLSFE